MERRKFIKTTASMGAIILLAPKLLLSSNRKSGGIANGLSDKFANPAIDKCPEIRWWLAEGSHTDATLRASVNEIKNAGYGGVEVLTLTEPSLDKSIYGWGSTEWNNDTKVIFEESTKLGLSVSFTSGPNWQPAIPGITPDEDAASQELDYAIEKLSGGSARTGELKKPEINYSSGFGPESSFITTPVVKDISKQTLIKVIAARLSDNSDPEKDTVTLLSNGTLVDITHLVNRQNNTLSWTAPDKGNWIIFSFWMHGTGQKGSSSFKTSYVVNHFDPLGAKAQIEYWDRNMLSGELRDLIRKNGKVNFFQDSLEIRTTRGGMFTANELFWSKDFLNKFLVRRRYDLSIYLPLIILLDDAVRDDTGSKFEIEGQSTLSRKIRKDYWQTLTELYQEIYLDPIRIWLNGHEIKLRTQISYGKALETSLPIKNVDIPEMETLYQGNEVDAYRTQTGAAHLYGKNVISSETGALFSKSYIEPVQTYLKMVHTQFAGGINRCIFHGYSSKAGPSANTKWPGYEGIGFIVSERWGDRMPMWRDARDFTAYIGRLQTVLQEGAQTLDLGILRLSYFESNMAKAEEGRGLIWKDLSLQKNGYTYEFFAPQILEDESIKFSDGVFAEGGPAYKAIIIYQSEIPLSSAKRLLEIAKQGLPVVIVKGAATATPFNDNADRNLTEVIGAIKTLSNVKMAESETDVPAKLEELHVTPRVKYKSPNGLLNVQRTTMAAKYLYLYNPSKTLIKGELSIESTGKPYRLDAWAGKVTALGKYRSENGKTIINVSIPPEATAVFVFDAKLNENSFHAVASTADEVVLYNNNIAIQAVHSGVYKTTCNNGEVYETNVSVPSEIELNNWDLLVEDWQPGDAEKVIEDKGVYTTTEIVYGTKKNIISTHLASLKPWKDIPDVGGKISGIGTYLTEFILPENWTPDNGAYLNLSSIYGTISVYINDKKTDAVNLNNPMVDITGSLVKGINKVKVIVTTTLSNNLLAAGRYPSMTNWGGPPDVANYGLLGSVKVIPYTMVALAKGTED